VTILGEPLLLLGSQVATAYGKLIDLLEDDPDFPAPPVDDLVAPLVLRHDSPHLCFVDLYRASTGSSTPIRMASSRPNDAIREKRCAEHSIPVPCCGMIRRTATWEQRMRMQFHPDDEKAFYAARDELLDRFAGWAVQAAPDADPGLMQFALDYKWGYGDGHLGRWITADLHDLLIDWFPRKVTLDPHDVELVVPTMRVYLDWLKEAGLLDPASDRPAALRATLERLAPRFPAAMDDPSRHGLAKSFFGLLQAGGVDVTDQEAVSGFVAGFNQLPEEDRQRLLPLPGEAAAPIELPPVRLPSEGELAAAADAAPVVERLRRFTAWVGEGRKLTQKGRLTIADGKALVTLLGTGDRVDPLVGDTTFRTRSSAELPEVTITFAWARAAGLVRVVHGRVVPVKRSRVLLDRPLDLWSRALDGLRQLGPDILGDATFGSFLVEDMESLLPAVLSAMYAGDEPVPLRALADVAWNGVRGIYDFAAQPSAVAGTWRRMVASELDQILQHLELLGAVERVPAGPAPEPDFELPIETRYLLGGEAMLDAGFRLTALGTWGANRLLRELGADAPLVGDLATTDAATLLDRTAGYSEADRQVELESWCQARGGEVAAAELATLLAASDDLYTRMLGFQALGAAGPAGIEAVRSLRENPTLRAHATMWLVDHGQEKQEAIDRDMAARLLVETCALVAATDGPAAAAELLTDLGPPDEQATVVASLWRVDSPHVSSALDALATAHPHKQVAKAARKAAFKLRSTGHRS
jgi:hypothetical protein